MANTVSEHDKKYDRQLRLWGTDGQARLEKSQICLLGAGPEGTETIKNLVLPGVGRFTIIDGEKVAARDLTNNFFVTESELGQNRAEVVAAWLRELNPDVEQVNPIVKDPVTLIEENPDFVTSYTFILTTTLPESTMLKLADACHRHKIPLAIIRIYGWLCYLRLQFPSYPVIESKPENTIPDLRMAVPFPELKSYADSFELGALDDHKFSHVPFVVLLVKAVQDWRKANNIADDVVPTPKDKEGISKALNGLKRRGVSSLNFQEASKFALRTWVPYRIPDEVEALLNDEQAASIDKNTPNFWVAVHGLRQFRQHEGGGRYLPLVGQIPDMETESATFAEIKSIYNGKFEQDVAALHAHVQKALSDAGRDPAFVTLDYLRHIVRNVMALRNFNFRTIAEEYNTETANQELFQSTPLVDPASDLKWYFLMRAADRFRTKHGHFPCSNLEEGMEVELPEYEQTVNAFIAEHGIPTDFITADHILEFARWGGSTMHNMGAVLGGVASQEIIKGVTQQWEPLNNTWIFNGMDTTSTQLNL